MGLKLLHNYLNTLAEFGSGGATGIVGPNEWNDSHQLYLDVDARTTTTEALAATAIGALVTFNNAGAVAVTLGTPVAGQPATAGLALGFYRGWFVQVKNLGAGTVTITPTSGTIGSNATLVLRQWEHATIWSDGVNWQVTWHSPRSPSGPIVSSQVYTGPDGAVGSPTYSFANDPNSGMYSSGADALSLATGGVTAMRMGALQNVAFGGSGLNSAINVDLSNTNLIAASLWGYRNAVTIPATTTGSYRAFDANPSTAALTAIVNIIGFDAEFSGLNGSSATNLFGFHAASTLTGATNNYGFWSGLAAATGVWSFYGSGTAASYLAGALTVDAATAATSKTAAAMVVTGGLGLGAGLYGAGIFNFTVTANTTDIFDINDGTTTLYTVDTRNTITSVTHHQWTSPPITSSSIAGSRRDQPFSFTPGIVTWTGNANITGTINAATATPAFNIDQWIVILNDGGVADHTINEITAVYLAGAPQVQNGSGKVTTATNVYGLRIGVADVHHGVGGQVLTATNLYIEAPVGAGVNFSAQFLGIVGETLAHAVTSNGPTIASAATIAPTALVSFISGTTAIATITAPPGFAAGGGYLILIPTGLWTTTTAGNIALATTAVVSKALIMFYDATKVKWYPSY